MQTSRLVCLMISSLPLFATLGCGRASYYQNRVDPVIYPSERDPNSLSISAALPPELDVGYYPSRNIFTNVYVQSAALGLGEKDEGLLLHGIPSKHNFKNSVGLSAHLIKRYGKVNLSGGLGGDYGRSFGKNDANMGLGASYGTDLIEHDLRFTQAYFQGAFGWQFNSGVGFGFLYKLGQTRLDFKSGLRRGYQKIAPAGSRTPRLQMVTVEDLRGLKKTVPLEEFAHVFRYAKGPFEYQVQIKAGGSDVNYFNTGFGVTFAATYTIPGQSKKLKPTSKHSRKAATR